MAAHGWSRRFRFPGYDGALPKSLRSLRGRGKYQHKVNKHPSNWGLFELLATVAGQVLQEKNLNEDKVKNQIDCIKDTEKSTENEKVPQAAVGNVQRPQAGISGKPTDCSYNSKDVSDIGVTSATFDRSVKTNTKEGSQGSESVEEALNTCVGVPFVDSREEFNILDSRENAPNIINGIVKTRVIESRCTVWKGTNLESSKPYHRDAIVHHKGHRQSHARGSNEGSCMTSQCPSVLSCDRIEKDLTSVHTKPCKFVNNIASGKCLDSRQNLACITSKDNDDNISVSVPLEGCSSKGSSRAVLGKDLQQEELHRGSLKMDTSLKRKYFRTMAKDASIGASPCSSTKAAWRGAKRSTKDAPSSSPVQVNITSFSVPELCINLPKTATVATLKRAVMDAAINVLGGGLNVRVLYQGKKNFDENMTLVQMGIPNRERLDSLAFMLEPDRFAETTMNIEDRLFGLSKASTAWYPILSLNEDKGKTKGKTRNEEPCEFAMDVKHNLETERERNKAIEPGRGMEPDQCTPRKTPMILCRPLVLHPRLKDTEALDIVRAQQHFRGMNSGRRRVRRPFSVIEVAALVQTVEVLGTGRWREVKQQAFDHARHRTYVDLKDKWKTLVHTAQIAPHQRRGEPVPQELLDRVLKAHMYWAARQSKQQAVPTM